jgi:hypothetical protein
MLFWENFPGLHAATRVTDNNPGFIISSDQDPRSRYYVVRLDVNDKDGDRSLKMGKSGMFSFKAGTAPDTDWTFPFASTEEKRGTWKVALKKPLTPGEYGVFGAAGGVVRLRDRQVAGDAARAVRAAGAVRHHPSRSG